MEHLVWCEKFSVLKFGAEESTVIQRPVKPPPLACLVRSQDAPPKFWSRSISVSIMACHAVETSSILVETAKFYTLFDKRPKSSPFHGDISGVRIPYSVPSICSLMVK